MRRHRQTASKTPWASAVLVGLYLLGLGWLAPLVTAGLAAMDEAHGVDMVAGVNGPQVVLRHNASNPAQVPWHEHCAMASALTVLGSDDAGQQDHVLSFPTGVDVVRSASMDLSSLPAVAVPADPGADAFVRLLEAAPSRVAMPTSLYLDSTAAAVARVVVIRC
jgi:hypothetical protein